MSGYNYMEDWQTHHPKRHKLPLMSLCRTYTEVSFQALMESLE